MTEQYLLAAAIGTFAGLVLALPGIFLEVSRRTKNLPLILDIKEIWGHKLKDGEVFSLSLLLHLVLSALTGVLYDILMHETILCRVCEPFSFLSILMFAGLVWATVNLLIYPILGLGIFARKEGKMVWLETMITAFLLSIILWLGFDYFALFFSV